eukprot:14951-Heterococcus_DN1.PRE.2
MMKSWNSPSRSCRVVVNVTCARKHDNTSAQLAQHSRYYTTRNERHNLHFDVLDQTDTDERNERNASLSTQTHRLLNIKHVVQRDVAVAAAVYSCSNHAKHKGFTQTRTQ